MSIRLKYTVYVYSVYGFWCSRRLICTISSALYPVAGTKPDAKPYRRIRIHSLAYIHTVTESIQDTYHIERREWKLGINEAYILSRDYGMEKLLIRV